MNKPATIYFFLILLSILIATYSSAQKQVVFLQNGNVLARFTEGDRFKFLLKSHHWKEGYITELTDFSMITSALDTISFLSIEKISTKSIKRVNITSGLGGALFVAGIGYIALNQINSWVGTTKGGFDESSGKALAVAGVGAALLFIKPKYKKISRGVTIRTVDYRSPYFKLDR